MGELLALVPDFVTRGHSLIQRMPNQDKHVEMLLEGPRKAGLQMVNWVKPIHAEAKTSASLSTPGQWPGCSFAPPVRATQGNPNGWLGILGQWLVRLHR